jgi:hypothetical protein
MGKGSSTRAPTPSRNLQQNFGGSPLEGSVSVAPMSGYTRAGEGIMGAGGPIDLAALEREEMARQARERAEMQRQRQLEQQRAQQQFAYNAAGNRRVRVAEPRNGWTEGYGAEWANNGPGSPGWRILRGKAPWEDGRDK